MRLWNAGARRGRSPVFEGGAAALGGKLAGLRLSLHPRAAPQFRAATPWGLLSSRLVRRAIVGWSLGSAARR